MPYFRQISDTVIPASTSFRIPTICSSLYLVFFIACLLVIVFYYAEPLITSCTIFGGDVHTSLTCLDTGWIPVFTGMTRRDAGIRRFRYFYSVVILSMLSAQKLKEKILKDRYNSIIFKKSRGRAVYLVGGYIRDILRGEISKDRDFIVADDIKSFTHEIRKFIGGTLIEFKKGETTRFVLKDGVTLDFSRPMGTLEEDLSKRDFIINAIPWSPDSGIIDPYKGIEDIKMKRINSISEKNFKADPLRMLRAYRFAAELNGSTEEKTRRSIKTLYNKIKKVSAERITFELFNLLNSENPARYLNMALNDRILGYILSINKRTLEHYIKAIYRFKRQLKEHTKEVKVLLEEIFSQNITYKGLLLLELLLRRNGFFEPDRIPLIRISRNIK